MAPLWFQSHLGSILPELLTHVGNDVRMFQSHLGSILPQKPPRRRRPPQPVSIPPWFDFASRATSPTCWASSSFNPTLVRFCPRWSASAAARAGGFNPTLVRFCPRWRRPSASPRSCFNPTLVRFCHARRACARVGKRGFNPTLVRFCRTAGAAREGPGVQFQSHLGSILPPTRCLKATSLLLVSIPPWFDFAARCSPAAQQAAHVSIPPWFDFALAPCLPTRTTTTVSIPPWFDFALCCSCSMMVNTARFNPTLVRFCRARWVCWGSTPCQFQSHLGSILPRIGRTLGAH